MPNELTASQGEQLTKQAEPTDPKRIKQLKKPWEFKTRKSAKPKNPCKVADE